MNAPLIIIMFIQYCLLFTVYIYCIVQLVALVVKYADNIHKGFASSLSVVISGVTDVFLFKDMSIDQPFLTGTLIVLASCLVFVVHSVRQQGKLTPTHPPVQSSAPMAAAAVEYKPSVGTAPVPSSRIGGYTVTNRKSVGVDTPSQKAYPTPDHNDDDSESYNESVSAYESSDRGNLSRTSSGYNLPYSGVGRAAVAGAVGSIGPYVLSARDMIASTIYRPKSSKNLAEDESGQQHP